MSKRGRDPVGCPGPTFASIHRSAWNKNSANFAFWGFSEVRKDYSYGGCIDPPD
jgi:hypothetical protein